MLRACDWRKMKLFFFYKCKYLIFLPRFFFEFFDFRLCYRDEFLNAFFFCSEKKLFGNFFFDSLSKWLNIINYLVINFIFYYWVFHDVLFRLSLWDDDSKKVGFDSWPCVFEVIDQLFSDWKRILLKRAPKINQNFTK